MNEAPRFLLTKDFRIVPVTIRLPAWRGGFQADDGKVYRAEQLYLLRERAEAAGRAKLQKRIDRSRREAARLAQYSRNLGGVQ